MDAFLIIGACFRGVQKWTCLGCSGAKPCSHFVSVLTPESQRDADVTASMKRVQCSDREGAGDSSRVFSGIGHL